MAIGKYAGAAEVYLNGRLLAELVSFRTTLESGDQEVVTMRKGLAGFSDGPPRVEATFDTAIPKAGFEADYQKAIEDKATVRVAWIIAGKRRQAEGRIMTLDTDQGVNNPAGATCRFVGKPVRAL